MQPNTMVYYSLKKKLQRIINFASPLYEKIFSLGEIASSKTLQILLWVLLLTFYATFSLWSDPSPIFPKSLYTLTTGTCWPHFPGCNFLNFLTPLPYGYSLTIFYSFLFAVQVLIAWFLINKQWKRAHILLSLLFLWKLFVILTNYRLGGNFDYYDLVLGAFLLFLPYKEFFLRLAFVILYFLASTIKIHFGWILGTYFTSLQTGLPIFPDVSAPLFTNLVILMQMVGSWFLLHSNKYLQRGVLMYFILFHLYSVILVGYRYPTSALLFLLVLFGPWFNPQKPVLTKKSLASWALITVLFALQSIAILIPGDQKLTLEGNRYGLFMFEANHQCISTEVTTYTDGSVSTSTNSSFNSQYRCDPYSGLAVIKNKCTKNNIKNITWSFDHSIDGGPFYRIVDEQNACNLVYKSFTHNPWIKTFNDNPPIIGYPIKNYNYF